MAAAIRLARWHEGRTGTNPSVATLIVRETPGGPVIIGRGVTALGGRPHAEPQALAEAGEGARGATAYVTLEPCAHHGRTPPCAETLIVAGIARVVTACTDPDERVAGRGHALLRDAGIHVDEGILADEAALGLAGYLSRRMKSRVHVTVKMAISSDSYIGRRGQGSVAVTGPEARRSVHAARALSDVILVGAGTARADDPMLDCRLPGLGERSPIRLIADPHLTVSPSSALVRSAGSVPLLIATAAPPDDPARRRLAQAGADFIAVEMSEGRIALPELLEDLAGRGHSTLYVEGGAALAASFLAEGLVDRIHRFVSPDPLAGSGEPIKGPIPATGDIDGFVALREEQHGADTLTIFERNR